VIATSEVAVSVPNLTFPVPFGVSARSMSVSVPIVESVAAAPVALPDARK